MGILERHHANPILTRADVPGHHPELVDVSSVFNPGAVRLGDETILLLRVQNRGRRTFTLVARSRDGIAFEVDREPVRYDGIDDLPGPIYHCYDARLTWLEASCHVMFAIDMPGRCGLGLARTADFKRFQFLGLVSDEDNRNGVLFPERVGGRYLRLDRPNASRIAGGPLSGDAIRLSESHDLLAWAPVTTVAAGRDHYWDELIGPGPPPIKTREGWLVIYHGVATHLSNVLIYQAGVMLLDLADPGRVLARGSCNILEPRELYELVGQVPNVVFPSGAVVEEVDAYGFAPPDARLRLYYGAADTVVCLATCPIRSLIEAAHA